MGRKKDDTIDIMTAIRISAMWHVTRSPEKEDPEFQLRQMSRWYSNQFNYTLDEVDEIAIETIAMHYWEHHYQQMKPEDQEEEIKHLTQSKEEAARSKQEDDEFLATTIREAQEASNKIREIAKSIGGKTNDDDRVIPVPVMGQNEPTAFAEMLKEELKKPAISMTFISEEEMAEADEWDLFGKKPK